MQLILDTECSIDIKRNMSTFNQESLEEKLDDVIHELKTDICNSNKENIHSKDNIIVTGEKDSCAEGDKINGEEIVEVKSPIPVPGADNNPLNDKNATGEQLATLENHTLPEPSPSTADPDINEDEDSDPIVITHPSDKFNLDEKENIVASTVMDNEIEITHTENKENNCMVNIISVEVSEDADCMEENNDLMAENTNPHVDLVETVDLDDEKINAPTEKSESNEGQEILNRNNVSYAPSITDNNNETSMDSSIDISSEAISQGHNTQLEKEKITESMDIDSNVVNTGTSLSEESKAIPADQVNIVTGSEKDENSSEPRELKTNDNDIGVESIVPSVNKDEDMSQSLNCQTNIETEPTKEEMISESNDVVDVDIVNQERNATEEISVRPLEKQVQENIVTDLKNIPSVLKLSNTLDILSDDEEMEPPKNESQNNIADNIKDKPCIQIEDDDDIMLIDEEDTSSKDDKDIKVAVQAESGHAKVEEILDNHTTEHKQEKVEGVTDPISLKEVPIENKTEEYETETPATETKDNVTLSQEIPKPLLSIDFWRDHKKNLADMTREDLEEFCIIKIVESIVDRSNLSEIKSKLKTMAQNIEEYKKKATTLTKQNRDLQLVLKSVQEEQKKMPESPITPLKITRSVGMQVLMTGEKSGARRKALSNQTPNVNGGNSPNPTNKPTRLINSAVRPAKVPQTPQTIPVPRLVPANNNASKNSNIPQVNTNNSGKASPLNGMKISPTVTKGPEKRTHNRIQSVTVDLTDDEPPSKVLTRSSPQQVTTPPVRPVNPQNMLATQRHPLAQNSPRKVYIPISGPQNQAVRPGQAIMLKTVAQVQGLRHRAIAPTPRMPQNQVRMPRQIQNRHPAPLPEVKQYQTNHYKALPPAPDLKLSKVENGIVISWKIEGYQQDSYEEIASYQLYAYQETLSPPSTSLWKKIGDVKALPLPMACTLTQFMAGFKYYFAVRAVDIRSRYGPFSLPGSIILLNKM